MATLWKYYLDEFYLHNESLPALTGCGTEYIHLGNVAAVPKCVQQSVACSAPVSLGLQIAFHYIHPDIGDYRKVTRNRLHMESEDVSRWGD